MSDQMNKRIRGCTQQADIRCESPNGQTAPTAAEYVINPWAVKELLAQQQQISRLLRDKYLLPRCGSHPEPANTGDRQAANRGTKPAVFHSYRQILRGC
jgi:hypothetical protein